MAEFQFNKRTYKGLELLSRGNVGNSSNPLKITRIAVGSGTPPAGGDWCELEDLVWLERDANIIDFKNAGNGVGSISVEVTNTGQTSGFDIWEIGVFAYDPDARSEILYSYVYALHPIWLGPFESTPQTTIIELQTVFGNAESVTVVFDDSNVYLTVEGFNGYKSELASALGAGQIGYDNSVSGLSADNVQEAIDEIAGAANAAPIEHASEDETYGKSSALKYGHAMAGNTLPSMDGTANMGADNGKYAREDHIHPSDTRRLAVAGGTMEGDLVASDSAVGIKAVRNIYAGTADMTAGSSSLATGAIYLVYE